MLRALERYRALPTPGGDHVFTLRFRPRWLEPSLLVMLVGLAVFVAILVRRPRRAPGVAVHTGGGSAHVLD